VSEFMQGAIAAIDAEIAKLQKARALLFGAVEPKKRGRRAKKAVAALVETKPKRRSLSPEVKKRMAEGQKRRWAAAKKSAKSGA